MAGEASPLAWETEEERLDTYVQAYRERYGVTPEPARVRLMAEREGEKTT